MTEPRPGWQLGALWRHVPTSETYVVVELGTDYMMLVPLGGEGLKYQGLASYINANFVRIERTESVVDGLADVVTEETNRALAAENARLRKEVERLTQQALDQGEYIGKRYEQALAHIEGLRALANRYEQVLGGPPKD